MGPFREGGCGAAGIAAMFLQTAVGLRFSASGQLRLYHYRA